MEERLLEMKRSMEKLVDGMYPFGCPSMRGAGCGAWRCLRDSWGEYGDFGREYWLVEVVEREGWVLARVAIEAEKGKWIGYHFSEGRWSEMGPEPVKF